MILVSFLRNSPKHFQPNPYPFWPLLQPNPYPRSNTRLELQIACRFHSWNDASLYWQLNQIGSTLFQKALKSCNGEFIKATSHMVLGNLLQPTIVVGNFDLGELVTLLLGENTFPLGENSKYLAQNRTCCWQIIVYPEQTSVGHCWVVDNGHWIYVDITGYQSHNILHCWALLDLFSCYCVSKIELLGVHFPFGGAETVGIVIHVI